MSIMNRVSICVIFILLIVFVNSKTPRIVIIGAGAAGIAAGSRLIEHGFNDVVILEAEKRYGGRIHTVYFGNSLIELGAQWCYGQENNIVYEMAKQTQYLVSSEFITKHSKYFDSSGNEIHYRIIQSVLTSFDSIISNSKHMNNYDDSVGNYFFNELEQKAKNRLVQHELKDMCIEFYDKIFHSSVGADSWFDITTKSKYISCFENQYLVWKQKGYKTIIDLMLDKNYDRNVSLKEKIKLNREISNITIIDDHVLVKCKGHCWYRADHVIVTVSLGVLKDRIKKLFTPKLPMINQKAIEGLNFGKLCKIFLKFSKPWWPPNCFGFNFLWNKNPNETLYKVFGGRYEDNKWLTEIMGAYPVEYNSNVILLWIGGPAVDKVEALPMYILKPRLTRLLRHFLGKYYTIPYPERMFKSKWNTNPYFKGVYSYNSMKTRQMNVTPQQLSTPVKNRFGKPVIHFAGEATHDYYYSTVHGAIGTGYREADYIAQLYL